MNVATVHPIRPDLALTFDNLCRVMLGLKRIDFIDFRAVVNQYVKAADNRPGNDKLMTYWREFQQDPMDYITTRQPRAQGEALFRMALARVKED